MSDAKYFQRGKNNENKIKKYTRPTPPPNAGKIQELRAELTSEKRDQKHQRKKTVMKKIVANMTMGNDMSPLFPDILNVMQVPVLEIKKMVYLYIINYARTKPDMAVMAISMFIKVSFLSLFTRS
jgi:vesicle coat complex subunit